MIGGEPANLLAVAVATKALTIASGGEPIAATAVAATPANIADDTMLSAPTRPCISRHRPNRIQAKPVAAR